MPLRIILVVLALFAGPITDARARANLPNDANALDDTSWSLSGLSNQSLLPDRRVTIHFENGRVHGIDGGNSYSASYTAVDARFKVGAGIVTTRMACAEPLMQQAAAFMRVLSEASGYQRDTRRLALLDADGKELAVFDAQSRELGGTSWIVTGYNNGKQAVVSVAKGSELTAVFNSDGTLSGSAGCNTYTATYETSGKQIDIYPAAATFKMCAHPVGVVEQEAQYLKALETAASYRLDGSRLELRTADGALAATLTAKAGLATMNTMPARDGAFPAALLQGAEWVVEDINRTGIIDRSRATINFGTDGRISGRASCNTYTGEYTLTGEGLTVAKTATTRMACAPALMRQEDLFLDVLRNLQRFTLSPDGALILQTGDGRTITARRG
jgi:heat shock protein HslJ